MTSSYSTVDLPAKVAFLRRPESHGSGIDEVEDVETHMAWVFLAGRRAYKLKKPVRYPFLDFSTLEARRCDSEEEVRLNRRLAPHVYLGTTPLTVDDQGALRLGGDGAVVDWLVVMRRLPRHGMLDRAIREGRADDEALAPAAALLADFFARLPSEPVSPSAYVDRLRHELAENRRELLARGSDVPEARARQVADRLEAFLTGGAPLLEDRARRGRIVEGHGDLRPEHVFLGPPPAVIDCLEFNREFRVLDPLDELAFLGLECERLGTAEAGATFLRAYHERTSDAPAAPLLAFYAAHRGLLRAKIAIWHLADTVHDRSKWTGRCAEYLELAERHAGHVPPP